MTNRMRANIATSRRNARPQWKLPAPEVHLTRDEGGFLCPACARFGRQNCRQHRDGEGSTRG